MQPTKQSIHDIFSAERRYLVPLYQRSYVWSREKQWEPLWHDIEQQTLSALFALKQKRQPATHFLGALVISARKTVGLAHPVSEIIDGQQRLTTFQIFLAAFRDILSKTDFRESFDSINRVTRNPQKRNDPDGIHKVWPTNSDREAYVKVTTAGSRGKVLEAFGGEKAILQFGPRIPQAYLYFSDALQNLIGGLEMPEVMRDFTEEDRIDALTLMLRDQLMCVVIELEENDDPQIIFETLNARGQPLLPSDLIRNFLFLEASNRRENTDQLYEAYWKEFDDLKVGNGHNDEHRFWHLEERQGRLNRPRIDLFMFHFISMKAEREVNLGQLYTEFRNWQSQQEGSVEEVLKQIAQNRSHFKTLIDPKGSSRLELFARRLKSLDTSTIYPVLLYLMSLPEHALGSQERNQIVVDLESYMVRRFLCNLTNKNYNRFFITLLAAMRKAAESGYSLLGLVRAELLRPEGPAGRWPDDAEFERGWLENAIYVKSRPDRSVMVLKALEMQLRTTKSESVSLPDGLTVEHILPQAATLDSHPYGGEEHLKPDETPELGRVRIINTLGNLTLLTGPLNSSVGAGVFNSKIEAIATHSLLRLNILLQKQSSHSWSEDEIIKRGKQLFESAKVVWPRPEMIEVT